MKTERNRVVGAPPGSLSMCSMTDTSTPTSNVALRALRRYLPWLRRDALHPSAPDATRVARLNQRFPR